MNLNNLISNVLTLDFNVSGAVTLAQLPLPGQPTDHLDDLDDLLGTVQNVDATNKKFTLHTLPVTSPFRPMPTPNLNWKPARPTISRVWLPARLSKSTLALWPAEFRGQENRVGRQRSRRRVARHHFKIDDAMHFEMVVLRELRAANNVNLGDTIVVTLNNANFQVDTDGLTVPSSLQGAFEAAGDTSQLIPGQEVQVKEGSVTVGPPIAMTTSRVRRATSSGNERRSSRGELQCWQLAWAVHRRGRFHDTVQTSSKTNFQDVAGLSSLADQDHVS